MGISNELAELNVERYQSWGQKPRQRKRAVLAFRGDVYLGLEANEFSEGDFTSAQRRVRILSGLYGLLRPLDLIYPYRLEMGTTNHNGELPNLYDFWGSTIADQLNTDLASHRSPFLVNCASGEYFPPEIASKIEFPIVNCRFLERHGEDYRFMSYFGKRARGLLARHVVLNRVETRKGLKEFCSNGYVFSDTRSSRTDFVYLRDERPT